MKRSIAGRVTILCAALVMVGTAAAFNLATDEPLGHSTRSTYVVGGEIVHPPAARALEASSHDGASTAGTVGTRYGYVVGGELISPAGR